MRRHHPTPTKPRTSEHRERLTSASNADRYRMRAFAAASDSTKPKSASRLDAHNCQTATMTFQQFPVFSFLLLSKQPGVRVSSSAPATACNALGPTNNDVANARAHDMDIMRANGLLHARKAGRPHLCGLLPPVLENWPDFQRTG